MNRKQTNHFDSKCHVDSRDDITKRRISKVETLYTSIICFTTNFLSFITIEAGNRATLENLAPKSAAFNALFRRNYNLQIKILAANVIAGIIATIMMVMGEKYNIPYLYIPWLVNTMKGIAFCEGPTLFDLAYTLLPNVGISTGSFMLMTLLLYAEELCVWSEVFSSFKRCWIDYNNRRQTVSVETKKESATENNAKHLSQESINKSLKKFRPLNLRRKSFDFYDKIRY